MTVPFLTASVAQTLVQAAAALTAWKQAINTLSLEAARLSAAAGSRNSAEIARLVPVVQSALTVASRAQMAYRVITPDVPPDVATRWESVLNRTQGALGSARSGSPVYTNAPIVTTAQAPVLFDVPFPDVPDPNKGLRIPGTNIVLPWAAVIGVGVVIGVGIYMKMSSRRRSGS